MERKQDGDSIYRCESENLRTLPSQHDLATHHVVVEPVGRPSKDYENWEFCNIRIDAALAQYLRSLGGGDIDEGIRIATQFHQARGEQAG